MKRFSLFLASFLAASTLFAESVAINQFGYLNNNDTSLIIGQSEAQNLLNVDVTPGGRSVKKRSGYGSYKVFGTTNSVQGGYHFFDSSGNDVQLWGSSTTLWGIVSDGTPTRLVSSATVNSTWDCADSQGSAYCVNSNRNALIQTNGQTMTWFSTSLGTMVEFTPTRLVTSGVSGSPNTINFSQAGAFTNFTTGVNATDAFTEVIASPGGKVTNIRWACGKLLWWKDQSFGYLVGDDQFSMKPITVSDVIGTFDNTSAVDPAGNVWFRGQDGHIYRYDCSALQKMTVPITPSVQSAQKRTSNSWTQTTASDFVAGSFSPTVNFSTSVSVGDLTLSTYSRLENSSGVWNSGSATNVTVNPSSFTITIDNNGTISDPSFEGTFSNNFNNVNLAAFETSYSGASCTRTPQDAAQFLRLGPTSGTGGNQCNQSLSVQIIDPNTNATIASQAESVSNSCTWLSDSLNSSSNKGRRVKFKFKFTYDDCAGNSTESSAITVGSYIFSGGINFYTVCANNVGSPSQKACFFDNVTNGSSTITTGTFISQVFDTGITSTVVQGFANWSVNTSTPVFSIQTSSALTGPYATVATSSGTNATANRYVRYVTTFTVSGDTLYALTAVSSVTIVVVSTGGTYLSAVKSAPNFSSWGTLGVTAQNDGGVHTYYVRGSTNIFTVGSSTPTWTTQTNGNVITASTGTYLQFRDDFTAVSASSTLSLNDFTLNWFEGSATDQSYGTYFKDAIWWSVPLGTGQSTNNYIFKCDLIHLTLEPNESCWTLYNFGSGGFLTQGNNLYFGSPSTGTIYIYGSGTSDNGSSISTYWQSKDFAGQDPWKQNTYDQLDTYWGRNQNQSMTVGYTLDASTSPYTYSVNLSSSTKGIIRHGKILPSYLGDMANVKVSDNSTTSSWEFLGFRLTYSPQPYRPSR